MFAGVKPMHLQGASPDRERRRVTKREKVAVLPQGQVESACLVGVLAWPCERALGRQACMNALRPVPHVYWNPLGQLC